MRHKYRKEMTDVGSLSISNFAKRLQVVNSQLRTGANYEIHLPWIP
jgi:hypothetical protein